MLLAAFLFVSPACSTTTTQTPTAVPSPSPVVAAIDLVALGKSLPVYANPDCRFWPEACSAAPGEAKRPGQGRWQNFHVQRLAVKERNLRVCALSMAFQDGAATRPAAEAIASCERTARLEIAVLENDRSKCMGDDFCTRNFEERKTLPPPRLLKVCEQPLPDADRVLCIKQRQEGLGIR